MVTERTNDTLLPFRPVVDNVPSNYNSVIPLDATKRGCAIVDSAQKHLFCTSVQDSIDCVHSMEVKSGHHILNLNPQPTSAYL